MSLCVCVCVCVCVCECVCVCMCVCATPSSATWWIVDKKKMERLCAFVRKLKTQKFTNSHTRISLSLISLHTAENLRRLHGRTQAGPGRVRRRVRGPQQENRTEGRHQGAHQDSRVSLCVCVCILPIDCIAVSIDSSLVFVGTGMKFTMKFRSCIICRWVHLL